MSYSVYCNEDTLGDDATNRRWFISAFFSLLVEGGTDKVICIRALLNLLPLNVTSKKFANNIFLSIFYYV